jgi:hypothetical protein
MRYEKMDPLEFIVSDLLLEGRYDKLLSALFVYDDRVDAKELLHLVKKRFNSKKSDLSNEAASEIDAYIAELNSSDKKQELLIVKLRDALSKEFDPDDIERIEGTLFWYLFSASIKKCLIMPKASIDESKYYNTLGKIISEDLSRHQRNAHDECIIGFNLDLAQEQSLRPLLEVFVPPLRNSKKLRTKKKNIRRTLRNAHKVMLVHKLFHSKKIDYTFNDRVFLVPEQFVKVIIRSFLSD